MTLEAYLVEWVELRAPGLRPRTIESYTSLIRLHIVPAIGQRKLSKLKPKHIARMLQGIIDSGHTRTAELCFVVLRAALRSAVEQRLIDWTPVAAVSRPRGDGVDAGADAGLLRGYRRRPPPDRMAVGRGDGPQALRDLRAAMVGH